MPEMAVADESMEWKLSRKVELLQFLIIRRISSYAQYLNDANYLNDAKILQ